jgi:hypothetical protein
MKIALSVLAGRPRRGWFKVELGSAGFVRVKLYELPDEEKDRLWFTIGAAARASEELQKQSAARLEALKEDPFALLTVQKEFAAAVDRNDALYLGALRELVARSVVDHAAEDFQVQAPPGATVEDLLDLGLSEEEAAGALERGSVAVAFEGMTWQHEPSETEKRIEEDRQKRVRARRGENDPAAAPRDLVNRPGASPRMLRLYENSLSGRLILVALANASLWFQRETAQDGAYTAEACLTPEE